MESDERLEQRVKTLEYEFKVLKNELQRTLLDIQEQILVHYYPALRSDSSSAPAADVMQSFGSIQEKRGAAAGAAGGESPNGELPQVKKVSLEEVRKTHDDPTEAAEAKPAVVKGPKSAQPDLIALTNWVNSAVPKIGKDRATKLLEMVGQRGYLAADAKDVLVKLCAVTAGDIGTEKVATNDILSTLLKLNELLGRGTNVEEALSLIDEAKLG